MKEKIKQYLLSYLPFLILFIIIIIPLPYYIEKEGGLISTKDRIEIEDSYSSTGSFHMAYVSELKVNIPLYIMSLFNKEWDLIPKEQVVLTNETEEDVYFRSKLMLKESIDNAIIAAYTIANKEINIENEEIYVTYIDKLAKTNLQIQDKILKINEKTIKSKSDIYNVISGLKKDDIITLEVNHNGKIENRTATITQYNEKLLMGIMINVERKITTDPKITSKFEKSESGSSGGLMLALQIYDYLTEEDITKGLKIAGTGTIDSNGQVGEISGVKYKLKGAVKDNADIFLVPNGDNYEEAIKTANLNNLNIKIINVSTLKEAIEKIKEG